MKDETVKKGFKVISITGFILKIITILTIVAMIVSLVVIGTKNNKEIEETQVVAEIEYTDDVNKFTNLEILQNTFGIKIYDEEKANENIIAITVIATLNCIIEFVLLIMIFDGVQKLFRNLYKTDDGFATNKNANIMKKIGIVALLKLIIPFTFNIITHYMLSSTIGDEITILQIICTMVIVIIAFATCYKIRIEQKNEN